MAEKILFIDRDGTLIHEPEDFQVDTLDKVRLVDDVIPALLEIRQHGYRFVMVSNQDGLGTDAFPQDDFDEPHALVMQMFSSQGIEFDEIFICPHLPEDDCECRKPRTGLLTRFLAANNINLEASAVIGDRQTDMELAERIGVRGLLVNCDDPQVMTWPQIVDLLCHSERTARVTRNTSETRIETAVNLDSTRGTSISTGIGFFDHMLEQVAKHGGFALELTCSGDLEVDEHHTVEDVAICLGTALRQNCRSLTNFELLPQPPENRAPDNPWPTWPKIFRTDYGHAEATAKFERDPRVFSIASKEFLTNADGQLTGINTIRVRWYQENSRWQMREIPGTEQPWPADLAFLALGFLGPEETLAQQLELECDDRSNFKAEHGEYATSIPGVFAAGDCRRGQSLVVWAIQEGRGAARAIDLYLMGNTRLP